MKNTFSKFGRDRFGSMARAFHKLFIASLKYPHGNAPGFSALEDFTGFNVGEPIPFRYSRMLAIKKP